MGEAATHPASLTRALEALARRVYDIERRLGRGGRTYVPHEIPFSYPGPLDTVLSEPKMTRYGGYLTAVVMILGVAGDNPTVVTVYRNAISIGTVTLDGGSPGTQATRQAFNDLFSHDSDLITFEITTAGDGAEDLSVEARFN